MSRLEKLASVIKKEISDFILNEMKPNGLLSITGVELAKDLSSAKIFFSFLGAEEEKNKVFKKLRTASGYIKGRIGKVIHTKMIPNLTFIYDDSLKRGSELIDRMNSID